MPILIEPPGDLDAGQADRSQHEYPVLVGGDDMDRSREVPHRHVVDAVLLGSVGAGVGDGPATAVDDSVTALFDPLGVPEYRIPVRHRRTATGRRDDSPCAPQVGRSGYQGLGASGQYRRREVIPIASGWGVGHGDVVGLDIGQGLLPLCSDH